MPKERDGGNSAFSLARAEDLIDAFLQTIRGLSFRGNPGQVDLPRLVETLVRQEQSHSHGADAFFASVEDDTAFRRLLVANLSSTSVLHGRAVAIRQETGTDWDGAAITDVARFQNVLLSTLEPLAVANGAKELELLLTLEQAAQLYRRAMQQMGGDYEIGPDAVRIRLPPAAT